MSVSKVTLCAVGFCLMSFAIGSSHARETTPATDYNKRLRIWQTISPGGDTPFGERINLYTGELTFSQADVDFPGIGPDIGVTRFTITSQDATSLEPFPFGNWDMALPRIETLVSRGTKWKPLDVATGKATDARCTKFGAPFADGATGITLITGTGESQPLLRRTAEYATTPSMTTPAGQPMLFTAVTNANWQVGCLPATTNGQSGEGFLVVSPDGTRYSLTHLTYTEVETLFERDNGATIRTFRDLARMSVSKIEDRFGNTVAFTYSGKQLTRIEGSDGRRVDLAWRADVPVISAVTLHATDATPRTWQYQYAIGSGSATLAAVVLPDASRWQYSGSIGEIHQALGDARLNECTTRDASPLQPRTSRTGTIVSPSGLTGSFETTGTWRGRSYVPSHCDAFGGAYPIEGVPPIFGGMALTRRTISGPGIPAQAWTYAYSPAQGSTDDDPCFAAGDCADTAWVDISDPAGNRTRHTYSTRWGVGEGRQLKVETYQGASTLLRTESYTYAAPTQGPWPSRIGKSLNDSTTNVAKQEHWAPMAGRTITQQGVEFRWTVDAFDAFARPTLETRAAAARKVDGTVYRDNVGKWILGQVERTTSKDGATGVQHIVSRRVFANDLPVKSYAYEKLQHTIGYNADGTVAAVADGRDSGTFDTDIRFQQWKRGIPQRIQFVDGVAKSATVNDLGQITSVTDENGYKTCHAFDAMGRLAQTTYPSNTPNVCDESAWNRQVRSFSPKTANDPDFGLGANHWVERVNTGNGFVVTHYDGLWRPSVVERYDSANKAATLSQTVTRYDAAGNIAYQSYPTTSIGTFSTTAPGTRTTHDALGRPTRVEQDSELGVLATRTEYLAGFQTRITNPRGFETLMQKYLAFDQPTVEWPLVILREDTVTSIDRDIFGKPTAITRRNGDASVSLTRAYAYNAAQELCRSLEPETGATLMGYDAAGNLAWSASGLPSSVTCASDPSATPVVERRSQRSYDARNRLVALTFADDRGGQAFDYTPDGLTRTITTYNQTHLGEPVINAYSYNSRRMVGGQGESLQQPGWYTWSLGFGYDRNGALAHHVHPDNLIVDYAPNALGQPTKAGSFATGASYFPNGALRQFTYGNGIVHTLAQNVRQLPDRSRDAYGGTAVHDDSYDHDGNGNVMAITDGANGRNQRGNRTMTYDGLDRLRSASGTWFGGTIQYTYDVLDNLQTVSGPGRDLRYCHDATSRRLAFLRTQAGTCDSGGATTTFAFDAQGNLQRKNEQVYKFGQNNRLYEVTGKEYYRYDGHGRRVLAWKPGATNILSHYSVDGVLRRVADYRRNITFDHVYLGGSLVATRERSGSGVYTTKYQHTDALGTPVVVTDANRNVVQTSEYEPYGKLLNRPVADGPGFTGHVADAATGLTYMQQRYYDTQIGTFPSVDPVTAHSIPGANFNRYWYANNNPYRYVDPDGRLPGDCTPVHPCAAGPAQSSGSMGSTGVARNLTRGEAIRVNFDRNVAASPLGPGGKEAVHFLGDDLVETMANILDGRYEAAARHLATGFAIGRLGPVGSRLDHLIADAQQRFPNKAGRTELHHLVPKYLGGAQNGTVVPLDAAYHQQITNEFRRLHPYSSARPDNQQLDDLLQKVYGMYPLP